MTRARVPAPPDGAAYGVLAHQPALLRAFQRLYGTLWSHGVLDPATKEVARIRNARAIGCRYCRNVRFAAAREQGLAEEDVGLVTEGWEGSALRERHKLAIRWTDRPHISLDHMAGAVRVKNGSKDSVDLTVIVVAVNEYGKAFALRYERLTLPRGAETPDLKFDSSLPLGQYTLHADAVGEVPAKNAIYRDRREVPGFIVQSQ